MEVGPQDRITNMPGIPCRPSRMTYIDSQVEGLPYYHGCFRNLEQIAVLMQPYLHENGCFIFRRSLQNGPGNYTISITHTGGIKHIRLYKTNNTFYLEEKTHFTEIVRLQKYYSQHDIPNVECIEDVRLKYPILNPDLSRTIPIETRPVDIPSQHAPPPPDDLTSRNSNLRTSPSSSSTTELRRSSEEDIRLPISPNKKGWFFSRSVSHEDKGNKNKENKKKGSNVTLDTNTSVLTSRNCRLTLSSRAPLPVPREEALQNATYSQVRDIEQDRTRELIQILEEEEGSEMCACGLPMKYTSLPLGWSLHYSDSAGRIFFQSEDGQRTTWNLPSDVHTELSEDHQENLRKLSAFNPDEQTELNESENSPGGDSGCSSFSKSSSGSEASGHQVAVDQGESLQKTEDVPELYQAISSDSLSVSVNQQVTRPDNESKAAVPTSTEDRNNELLSSPLFQKIRDKMPDD